MGHRQFSERFLAAMRAGDEAALREMMDPDFTVEEADSLPYGGTYRGVEGWMTLSRAVVAAWAGFRLELADYVAETPDSLVVRFRIAGRSRKTGRSFESSVMEWWMFKEGRLLRILPYYFDTHLLVAANAG